VTRIVVFGNVFSTGNYDGAAGSNANYLEVADYTPVIPTVSSSFLTGSGAVDQLAEPIFDQMALQGQSRSIRNEVWSNLDEVGSTSMRIDRSAMRFLPTPEVWGQAVRLKALAADHCGATAARARASTDEDPVAARVEPVAPPAPRTGGLTCRRVGVAVEPVA
jgi:hypothetical protein